MGSFASGIKSLLKVAFFAVLAAALVQAVRPPKDAPSENKTIGGDIVDAPSVALDLEEATASPRRFGYSEAQLNAYLKNRVKAPKNPTIPIWAVTFDKAFINLKPGSFRISKKYFVFTLPCYLGGTYLPTIENGVLKFQALSGNIGSLPLPGLLFDQVDQFIFADFIKNMKEEANGAAKMKSIEVTPKMVVITSGSGK